MGKQAFQAEVSRLLHLIIHSLYSHPEIFLRELISNASDALDRLKYLTLTQEDFKGFAFVPKIDISFDTAGRKTLSVADTGIGMNAEDLEKNLGTIASSGTRSFLESLSGDARKDSNLIGQFGVGFYSAFMVADRVEVLSRKAGEEKAWRWTSDGQGEYEIAEATAGDSPDERKGCGTTVTLHLNEAGLEFASRWSIENIVRKYSNHIAFPIWLHYEEVRSEGEGKGRKEVREQKVEQINTASALWKRPRAEISDEEYKEFYKAISHDTEDPLHWMHASAEGNLEYTTLFYIPARAPFDLYFANYRPGVKLYIRRVFITDDEKTLLPTWLRFIQGVIDSEDLPLNVSREMLQENRVLASIRSASVKRVLGELKKLAEHQPEKYLKFWREFGRPMKEGLFQDPANREALLELARFKSIAAEGLQEGYTSLAGYKERMKPDQKAVYYLTGGNEQVLRASPLLEAYRTRGIEVLVLDDEIDELVIPAVGRYGELELKAVNRADAAEELKSEADKQNEKSLQPLAERIRKVLGDLVKDVRPSSRLSDSPSCVVADGDDPSFQMQQMLKALGQQELPEVKPVLEINPGHEIVRKLQEVQDEALFEDVSRLLYEQALLLEGVVVKNPAPLVQRLNRVMARAL